MWRFHKSGVFSLAHIQTSGTPVSHRASRFNICNPKHPQQQRRQQQQLLQSAPSTAQAPCWFTLLTSSSSSGERDTFSHGLSNLFLWWVAAGLFDRIAVPSKRCLFLMSEYCGETTKIQAHCKALKKLRTQFLRAEKCTSACAVCT